MVTDHLPGYYEFVTLQWIFINEPRRMFITAGQAFRFVGTALTFIEIYQR
jgi:hypothetical protein